MSADFCERPKSILRREAFALLLVAIFAPLAAFALAGPFYFARPFWSDEVLSWLIATDPDFHHGMAALAGGVDTNAPLVHLLFGILGKVFGATPIVYRLAAMSAMLASLAGLYATLRRSTEPAAAAFGCLCFAALPIIVAHTTEARFYAFELAAAIWTNLLIARRGDAQLVSSTARRSRSSRGRASASAAILALTAVALSGVHYFGIIALTCIVIADFFRDEKNIRRWLERIWPTAAGFAMTACLLPLIIAQRTAMRDAGGTWVPNAFVINIQTTLETLLPSKAMFLCAVVALVSIAVVGRASIVAALREHRAILLPAAGYLAAMIAFDRVVQPVFVPRYFIVALPAVAAIVAAFASRWPTIITRAATAAVAMCLCVQWRQIRERSHEPDGRSAAGLLASVASVDGKTPIVSDWLGHAIPILQARPELIGRVSYIVDRRVHDEAFDSGIRYERGMATCVQRFYGLPANNSIARVERLDRFVLLTEYPETIGDRFGNFDARRLGAVTFELARKGDRAAKAE